MKTHSKGLRARYSFFILCVAAHWASAQWVQTNGPTGGSVICLAELPPASGSGPPVLFAGTGNGVYVSSDRGATWKLAPRAIPNMGVNCLGTMGTTIFAGTNSGISSSSDRGLSWSTKNNGLTNLYVTSLVACSFEAQGPKLYAGTSGGVFVSSDGGLSWSPSNNGLVVKSVSCIGVNGPDLYVGTGGGVYYSSNAGATWNAISPSLATYSTKTIAFIRTQTGGTNIYIGTLIGMYVSSDNGTSWIQINKGLTDKNIRGILAVGKDLYAATYYEGVFVLRENASSWMPLSSSSSGFGVSSLYMSTTGSVDPHYFAATARGVYHSTDGGNSWFPSNTGMANFNPGCFGTSVNGSGQRELYVGSYDAGLFVSTDLGETWREKNNGFPRSYVCSLLLDSGTAGIYFFAGTNDGVYRSSDRGNNWSAVNADTRGWYLYSLAAVDKYVIASRDLSAYRTSDNGDTWTTLNTAWNRTRIVDFVVCSGPTGGTYLFAVNAANLIDSCSGVYLSTDLGNSWKLVSDGLPANNAPSSIVVEGLTNGRANLFAGYDKGIYRSTNYGASWVPARSGVDSLFITSLATYNLPGGSSYLFAGTSTDGIFVSTNSGTTWRSINEGLSAMRTNKLTVCSDQSGKVYLVAGMNGASVWRRAIDEIARSLSTAENPSLVSHFDLEQNYPNPFNPGTTIRYSLFKASSVSLRIFNTLGQEIAVLVNERKDAGYHQVTWNGDVPSGTYFYRLQAGEYVETKKMILLH